MGGRASQLDRTSLTSGSPAPVRATPSYVRTVSTPTTELPLTSLLHRIQYFTFSNH